MYIIYWINFWLNSIISSDPLRLNLALYARSRFRTVGACENSAPEKYQSANAKLCRYLAVDQFGNVTCENEEKDATAKFEISVCDDFSGRWAFRSVARYVGLLRWKNPAELGTSGIF